MVVYNLSLPNSRYGHLMPPEDALAMAEGVYVVADGITRDPLGIKDFTGYTWEELLATYPQTSGAAIAAEVFCRRFVKAIGEQPISQEGVRRSFVAGNNAIRLLNDQRVAKVDYLINDYCACVAAGGVIDAGQLLWGCIGDSGVAIYTRGGQLKFISPNGVADFANFAPQIGFDWNKPAGRKLIRSRYRNNPNVIENGICVSYGALTGEKPAEHFMDFGTEDLEKGDLVVFFSDGFAPMLNDPEFFTRLYQRSPDHVDSMLLPYLDGLAIQDPELYGKERSLISILYE